MASRFSVIGQTGLVRHGDHVYEEWNRRLTGDRWRKAVREMRDTDSTIGAGLLVMSSFLRQTPWYSEKAEVKEGSGLEAQAEEAQVFLDECMGDMSHTWAEMLSEMMSTIPFGWANFEKVYKIRGGLVTGSPERHSKYDDGKLGWRKFAIRGQESLDGWEFSDEGDILGMYQRPAPSYQRFFVPAGKSVLFRTELNKNNPEGRSMLRNIHRPFYFLKRMQETEAVGTERDLVGLPYALLPKDYFGNNVDANKAKIRDDIFTSLKHLRQNRLSALVFPSEVDPVADKPTGFKVGLLSTGGRRALDISAAIDRYQRDIGMGMLTQFLFLGMQSTGSFALSSDMTNTFAVSLGAILDMFEETFHRYATTELMLLNGFPPEVHPRWKHGDIEKENMKQFAETLLALFSGGAITPDNKLEDFIRQKLELPEREEMPEDMDDTLGPMTDDDVESDPPPDDPDVDDDDDVVGGDA